MAALEDLIVTRIVTVMVMALSIWTEAGNIHHLSLCCDSFLKIYCQ